MWQVPMTVLVVAASTSFGFAWPLSLPTWELMWTS
jgi:hypothetical protein